MAHYTTQALCMHVVQCVWGPNKSTLPWKGLYQVEVVLSENWLGGERGVMMSSLATNAGN